MEKTKLILASPCVRRAGKNTTARLRNSMTLLKYSASKLRKREVGLLQAGHSPEKDLLLSG